MPAPLHQPEPGRGPQQFATTQWSVVISAGRPEDQRSRFALCQLCETYWQPLYAYARNRVADTSDAQDLTQSFFADLLEKNYVRAATPARGKFRAFLLTAFKHFLANERERGRAQKRGGGRAPIPLDFAAADSHVQAGPLAGLTAEQIYDRQWAVTLLDLVMEKLREEHQQVGKSIHFDELKDFLIGDHPNRTYAQVASTLAITELAARKAASRLRRRYRELLRSEIAQTVSAPDEIDDEIRNLFVTLELR